MGQPLREVYRLHGEYTAGRHAFGPHMTCLRCGIHWREHQAKGEDCPSPFAARVTEDLKPTRTRSLPTVTPFGERIRTRRLEFHISQDTLARLAGEGLRQGDVSRCELGIQHPPLRQLSALAKALRVSVAWLLGQEGDRPC